VDVCSACPELHEGGDHGPHDLATWLHDGGGGGGRGHARDALGRRCVARGADGLRGGRGEAGAAKKLARSGRLPRGRLDSREEKELLEVLYSGKWFRLDGKICDRLEEAYARLTGARYCIATANGTSALYASLAGLGVAPKDEMILPPYTFIATLNVIFLQYTLPIFVDSDPETFQINARKLKTAITEQTTVMIPIHLGRNACDLDAILEIAGRKKMPVLEDACQAHLNE
jgi:dTDP-4-amino-4,6-dideoxygalactose transaminase